MDINEVIIWILMICMVVGGIDRAIGNKIGLGEEFEEGFNALGSLGLAMVGIISLAPVLEKLLLPIIGPLYKAVGADPAMFAGTLLANDMGGWALAERLTENTDAQNLSGLILGSMMGATIVFTIPVSLSIIKEEDRPYLAKGVLAGIIAIPVGVLVGGLVAGMEFGFVLINVVPIIIVAALIALGLWIAPEKMTTGFLWFGKGLVFVITVGLIIATFVEVTGVQIMPAGWELTSPMEGIEVIGSIALVLLGAFPAVALIVKYAAKPLTSVGKFLGMNEVAAGGMIASLANNIPMFQLFKDMDPRGKVLNAAFAVPGAFILGDHLGFTAGIRREMIFPMISGKFVAAVLAVGIAILIFGRSLGAASDDSPETAAQEA